MPDALGPVQGGVCGADQLLRRNPTGTPAHQPYADGDGDSLIAEVDRLAELGVDRFSELAEVALYIFLDQDCEIVDAHPRHHRPFAGH
jgi:hypothetical protein